jgi:hypothetical protein
LQSFKKRRKKFAILRGARQCIGSSFWKSRMRESFCEEHWHWIWQTVQLMSLFDGETARSYVYIRVTYTRTCTYLQIYKYAYMHVCASSSCFSSSSALSVFKESDACFFFFA